MYCVLGELWDRCVKSVFVPEIYSTDSTEYENNRLLDGNAMWVGR
jgi:hypothetical protein